MNNIYKITMYELLIFSMPVVFSGCNGSDARHHVEKKQMTNRHVSAAISSGDIKMDELKAAADERTCCPLHGTHLEEDRVRIIYGLLRYDAKYAKARKELFPLSHQFVSGGCMVRDKTHKVISYCPTCRIAERQYKMAQDTDSGDQPAQLIIPPTEEPKQKSRRND